MSTTMISLNGNLLADTVARASVEALGARVGALENQDTEMNVSVEAMGARVDALEAESTSAGETVTALGNRLDALENESTQSDKEWLPDEECGVNVLPNYTISEQGYFYYTSGLKYNSGLNYYAFQPMIHVIAGQTYRITTNSTAPGIGGMCYWYDESGASIDICTEAKNAFTVAGNTDFVAPEGACFLGLSYAWGEAGDPASDWTSKLDAFMRITSIANSGEYVLGDMRLTEENLGTVEPFKSIRKRTIVTLGDSIFGMVTGDTGVSNLIAAGLGCTVINGAFGGTRAIARTEDSGYNDFDFTALVDAIIANDYSAQEAALTDHSMSSTIAPQLASLKTADFSKADIVTMNYGTNDYTGYFVKDTFVSGYKEAIGKLQAAFPQMEVVIITPAYRMMYAEDGSFSEDGDTHVSNNVTLPDVVEAVRQVAADLHLRCIDAYNIGIGRYNYSHYFGATDGVHHAENGRRRLAERIVRALW